MRLTAARTIAWNDASAPAGVNPQKVYFGPDPHGLGGIQVAVATSARPPSRDALRALFAARKGRTQVQLVLVVTHEDTAHMFGPDPQAQPIDLPVEKAQRQLQSVLSEPHVLAATERLAGFRKAHAAAAGAGFTNSGLFATHHLKSNLPTRSDWAELNRQGQALLTARGAKLIEALGFRTTPASSGAYLLSSATDAPRAVAVLLDDSENFEAKSSRFQLSPVAYGLAVAARHELPWLVVLRKDQIRLYPGRDGVGVGSKGQAETFLEVDLSTIEADFAALLPLIFSSDALAAGGSTDQLLADSARYATELGARLRERIYDEIVPPLAVEVAQQLAKRAGVVLDAEGLSTAYRVTLRILFRLLFQAYAEDRGLLPSGRNEGFDANSLKTNARRLLASEPVEFGYASTIWFDLVQVWNAIDQGNPQWQIPSYDGGLFSTDPDRSPEGELITRIQLPDSVVGPALKSLLVDVTSDGVLGAVDFRSLSVREFGTIYEGLLESSLSLADRDLTVNAEGAWIPAGEGDEVLAAAGCIYFHTASGERKATGSYFTRKVVVDHLIERSIVPALGAHLNKIKSHLERGDASAASRDFFDFRVADLAMGSGHFLVAAVDKIEALMRTFLTEHTVPGVTDELLRLANAGKNALGTDDVAKSEVDEVGLLRRQVARRCIYGLDINPMAVELARLGLWIHTFVPGLPMSNLDHGLVCANSLTGVGTIDEAVDSLVGLSSAFTATHPHPDAERFGGGDKLFGNDATLFDVDAAPVRKETTYQRWLRGVVSDYLQQARPILMDVASASEATKAEVDQAATALAKARDAAEPARRIFDAAVAARLGQWTAEISRPEHVDRLTSDERPSQLAEPLRPAHFPFLFPEVFLRDDPGFDVLLGNPPWDKVRWEAAPFWTKVSPGLMALPDTVRDARIEELRKERPVEAAREAAEMAERQQLQEYFKKVFVWRGGTHLELAQLMLERVLKCVRSTGGVGLVLPRQSLVLAGWKTLRKETFARHTVDLVQARNAGEWLFEDVHASYAIVLLTANPPSDAPVSVAVVCSAEELRVASPETAIRFTRDELASLSDAMVVPWFENADDRIVFDKLRGFPRLSGSGGWVTGTHDARWDFRGSGPDHGLVVTPEKPGAWRVMMTRHVDAFSLRNAPVKQFVTNFAALVAKNRGVTVDVDGRVVLGEQHPVVIFRHPSRSDDTRTLIAAALPATGYLHNKGYIHAVSHAPGTSQNALLALIGLLSTNIEDWWARRFVDRHVTAPVINNLPLPNLDETQIESLADRVAVLLASAGFTMLAGGIDVAARAAQSAYRSESRTVLLANLEATVARGYGLTADDLRVVRSDFSAQGMPDAVFDLACEQVISGAGV